jgi:predicted dinucleotide-binding enzyme
MKIGIIGSGIVGRTLGNAFLQEGYEVKLGSRNPSKEEVVKWKSENTTGLTGNFTETAEFADIIVLAVSGLIASDAIKLAGKNNFSGKIVIDTTNPISAEPPTDAVVKFFTDFNESLMEKLQHVVPDAKLVKAFNIIGSAVMYKPSFIDAKPSMFICGNDPDAKKTVSAILEKFGHEPEDMGVAAAARAIEPLAILWCIPGFINNDWYHAFKLLKL